MSKEYSRPQRVADFLQRELSVLIQQELRDPRIAFVSVTGVEVSRDLSNAKIYVTFLNEVEEGEALQVERRERIKVLSKASGFLRSLLAQNSKMRQMPQLRFYFDESIERASRMSTLIDKAVSEDQSRHQNDDGNADSEET